MLANIDEPRSKLQIYLFGDMRKHKKDMVYKYLSIFKFEIYEFRHNDQLTHLYEYNTNKLINTFQYLGSNTHIALPIVSKIIKQVNNEHIDQEISIIKQVDKSIFEPSIIKTHVLEISDNKHLNIIK